MKDSPVPALYILLIPLGFVIWSIAFVSLYALNAVGCEFGWDETVQRGVLIALTLLFLVISGVSALLVYRFWQRRARHQPMPAPSLGIMGIYGSGSAFVAMIGAFVPGLATSLCI